MAVLLRTEVDEDKDWDKCWSLGRVLRIITARHSIDVVWLKPVSGGSLPPERCSPCEMLAFALSSGLCVTLFRAVVLLQ